MLNNGRSLLSSIGKRLIKLSKTKKSKTKWQDLACENESYQRVSIKKDLNR